MSECRIRGALLMSRPEHGPVVERARKAMAGTELHANEDSPVVVAVEGDEYRQFADRVTRLATLDGVAPSSYVFHQIDTEDLL